MSEVRWLLISCALAAFVACANPEPTGVSVERVVSGDWTSRFADDPTAHLISLPPGRSYFDSWVYQFGGSPSDWPTHNMECGPACVSILERLSGDPGTSCAYLDRIEGCPLEVHSACRQTGVCGRSSGFRPSSSRGTTVYQMRDVLNGLGYTARAISGTGGDRVTFSALQRAIDADHPMVVTVDACEYRSELGLGVCSMSHFIVAYGYSDRYVYILDPGYRNGQRARISIDAFNHAIASDPAGVEVARPGFNSYPNATWYPPGSLLRAAGEFYYVVSSDSGGAPQVWHVSPSGLAANRLSSERALEVSRDVIDCFEPLGELDSTPYFREYRQETGEIYLVNLVARERYVFLNYAAYLSFAGREDWIRTTSEEVAEWSSYPLRGTLGFAPGMLVASDEPGVNTIWVVSYNEHGRIRLPIFNEETARVYGYDVSRIGSDPLRSVRTAAHDLDLLAGPEGETLRIELARDCLGMHCLTADACFQRSSPGGVDEASDGERDAASTEDPSLLSDRDGDGQPDSEDCAPDDASSHRGASELCDGRDNDCDGNVDEGVCAPTPSSVDPNLVRIRLTGDVQAECPLGWRIRLWLDPSPEESPRGGVLERTVARRDAYSSITLWCDERSPQWYVFDLGDAHALGSGIFAELSMGGVDLRSSTMVCVDPQAPGGGYRPMIMWNPSERGSCP